MMIALLNMGFVPLAGGVYVNYELNLKIFKVELDGTLVIETKAGPTPTSLEELKTAILSGRFGDF